MLLLPSLGLRWVSLLAMGAAAMAFPEFVRFGLPIPTGDLAMADIAKARDVYGNGGVISILVFRWHESWSLIVPPEIMILPRTVGLMY